MTEAGWTREKPTVAGWYWWRNAKLMVVYVGEYPPGSLYVMGFGSLANFDGEWLGPISPDSYRQGRVEGLREAVPLACKYCNDRTKWTPMSNSGYHVCNMPEPGFVRCQAIKIHAALAQQAQEGANNERT